MKHLVGVITFPAVLVQAGVYKLMGIPANCRWGELEARPAGPVTRSQVYLSRMIPIVGITLLVLLLRWWQVA